MTSVSYGPFESQAAEYVAAHMCDIDKREVRLSSGKSPLDALMHAHRLSEGATVTVYRDAIPCALYGVGCGNLLSTSGTIWMLGTDELCKCRRELVVDTSKVFVRMFEIYDILENYTLAENKRTLRWLRHLGFTVGDTGPFGVAGALFTHFYRRKTDV